ncbi:MAG: outer membrane protein OmpK [Sulfuricurvum sp.]
MIVKLLVLSGVLLSTQLSAFSSTDIQYLYGNFKGDTFMDTQQGPKHTVTLEDYRTFEYGDIYSFADYGYAPNEFLYSGENDLYGEISPRFSLNKLTGVAASTGTVKEIYSSFQYNRGEHFRAWLYGVGCDLNVPGFSVLGLNLYRKIQNIGIDTYQLSLNYLVPLSEQWHFEGFTDWTTRDFLSQNQLLLNISPLIGLSHGRLDVGTEWHYFHENVYHNGNSVFQIMMKYSW